MSKMAFVFAGQGAQTTGMGQDLYEQYDCVRELFDMSPEIRDLCFNGPKEELDITLNTQPAVFLTGLACAAVLSEKGIKAEGTAGFSLGEITAACYSGLMSISQAYNFVCYRAKAMHECALQNKGCMFAVLKLSVDEVKNTCGSISDTYPVNYNSPGQTVVACAEGSADELQKAVSESGGKSMKLAASGAFHSPFMDEASKSVSDYLESISLGTLQIPLYSNTIARIYDNAKELLAKQINHPVLWQKTIENMISDGFDTFIEAGPGKTLSGLIKKINSDVRVFNVSDVPSLENTVNNLG